MNKTITRTMCILLALVLMSSSAVSYTYAEYARGASAADVAARSSNWGVTVDVVGGVFATKYVSDVTYSGIDTSVKSSTLDDILAPGTTGTFSGINVTGVPEVSVKVEITPDLQLTNWVADGKFYCPLKITINNRTYSGLSYSSSADFEAAIENAIRQADGIYGPNTDLSQVDGLNGNYTWTWDYGLNSDGSVNEATNAKDTQLQGKAMIALSVNCYVYQVGDDAKDDNLENGGGLDVGEDGEIEWD